MTGPPRDSIEAVTTQTPTWQGEPPVPPVQRAVPGTVIGGRYQLRSPIGNGGMGTVWQAVDTVLRRDVAVKEVLLPPGMPPAERTAMYERTFREGRAAAALSHPSVVQVYDVVTENGRPWIVMELLQARSLSEIILSDGPVSGRAVAKIGIALLGALEVAHAAGVLHRDVKPANVLICSDGRCVLTDFGVARMPAESNLTQPGMVLGSPHFISPERAIGAPFGPPSDLFSLGVTLYTAAEGRPPFDRGDPFETMRAIVEDEPTPTSRAGVLTPVLMGLLAKDPDKRWTVGEARQALRDLVAGALSNRAANTTDPHSVMPPSQAGNERPGTAGAVPALALPAGPETYDAPRLGGRALLADGESIADRLGSGSWPTTPQRTDYTDPTERGMRAVPSPLETTDERRIPTGPTMPGPGGPGPGEGGDAKPPATARAMSALTRMPRGARWALAGLAGAAVVATGVILVAGGGGSGTPGAGGKPSSSPSAAGPTFAVQSFHDTRGITLNVPANWRMEKTSNYTNFVDPADKDRRLRINVEVSGKATATEFLNSGERRLRNTAASCPNYQHISATDITLDGHPGAQLEYTCGSGDTLRHGIWAVATEDGHAYEFYLTVPDVDFQSTRGIYDEMVASVKLDPSG